MSIPNFLDIVTISLNISNTNIIISGIYKSPKSNIINFSDFIYNNFNMLSVKNNLFLVGDFNVNILDVNNNYNKHFIDTIYSMGCFPLVTRPKRYGNTINSLIDNIYCNANESNGIIISDISDHLPIYVIYDNNNEKMKKYFKKYKFIRKINDKSNLKFRESISKYDWDYIYSNNDINSIFNYFIDNLIQLYNIHCPMIKVKENSTNNKPWLYFSLIKCINKKNRMYKKLLKLWTTDKFKFYKKYKNILTSLLRRSEYLYYSFNINNNSNNSKYTWSVINKLLNKKKYNLMKN